jgi:large subunit ribosomal protein L25
MSKKTVFSVKKRSIVGKKVKTVRSSTVVPANVMGDIDASMAIEMSLPSFQKMFDQVGETGLVYLQVEGESSDRPVLVSDVQRDPVSDQIIHVVFRQVDLTEKVTAEVPVEVTGVFDVKNAVLATVQNTIKVSALPTDLPEKFVVDVSGLKEFGQAITFADLQFDKDKVTLLIDESEWQSPVVMAQEVKEEVEEVVPVVAAEGAAATPGAEGTAPAADGAQATADKTAAPAKKE